MKDKFEFDISTLKSAFDNVPNLVFCSLHSCIAKVTIGTDVRAAALAGDFGIVSDFISPSDAGAAVLAVE